jgi:epoxyqueuosine reductase
MERDFASRADAGARLLPGARCVVMALLPYPPELDPASAEPISCYARGADYHRVLGAKLDRLAVLLAELLPGVKTRRFVDTAPLLERAFAHRAGLGFFGKNTCLIHPRLGSYFFLGGVALDRELPLDAPLDELPSCGTCTRCLEACPTGAIPSAHRVDSRRCISYLTIEHRGAYDESLRALAGTHVYGCDICQAVCPWNSKFAPDGDPAFAPRPELAGPLAALYRRIEASFKGTTRDTALPRALKKGFLRNIATAMGNSKDPEDIEVLRELANHEDASVRDHGRWAMNRRDLI